MSWVAINGYKWPYRINEDARLQRLRGDEWVDIHPYMNGKRAIVKMRTIDSRGVCVPLVWLMADAFLGGRRKGYAIVHRNGVKLDCSVWNLKFVPVRDSGRISCKNRERSVEKIDADGNVLELYRSIGEAAEKNFICYNSVYLRCKGRIKNPFRTTEFTFRYEKV